MKRNRCFDALVSCKLWAGSPIYNTGSGVTDPLTGAGFSATVFNGFFGEGINKALKKVKFI